VNKVDGVIEAVRYRGGKIEKVRLYERRGATFSDHVLLDRAALLARLQEGTQIVTGYRRPYLASTFDVERRVLLGGSGGTFIVTSPDQGEGDHLEGVPSF
jgi:hypothetical protein